VHDEIERLVGHLRERMRRVQPHGDEQRAHLALKVLVHPFAVGRLAIPVRDDFDAVLLEGGHQLVVVQRVLAAHQIVRGGGQCREGVDRVRALEVAALHGGEVGRGAHFEKLVQVGRHDAQVAQALQQGHVRTARPVEHPLVESQDAVVAVQEGDAGCVGHQDDTRMTEG
jgi:hypothetical protein